MGEYTHFVIIVREGRQELTGFYDYDTAKEFFDTWSSQWSESFLCEVKIGPKV